jgi:uncharacterized membrane protein YgaE (UPF0421/DUF939 family)
LFQIIKEITAVVVVGNRSQVEVVVEIVVDVVVVVEDVVLIVVRILESILFKSVLPPPRRGYVIST